MADSRERWTLVLTLMVATACGRMPLLGVNDTGDGGLAAANQQVLDAVMFSLFVLGEAAKGIPAEVRARYAIVEWRTITRSTAGIVK